MSVRHTLKLHLILKMISLSAHGRLYFLTSAVCTSCTSLETASSSPSTSWIFKERKSLIACFSLLSWEVHRCASNPLQVVCNAKIMAKGAKSKKSKAAKKAVENKEQKPKITLQDLEAMSSDDESPMPPEEEWNDEAKALYQSIKDGSFDHLIAKAEEPLDDDESIEEVDLNDAENDADPEESSDEFQDENQQSGEDSDKEDDGVEQSSTTVNSKKASLMADADEEEEDASEAEESGEDTETTKEHTVAEKNAFSAKALHVVIQELKEAKKDMPWEESFDVMPPTALPFGASAGAAGTSLDIHDDLKREVAFYDMALEAVHEARKRCEEANIPFRRPDDFFAEMVKTDGTCAIYMCRVATCRFPLVISHCVILIFCLSQTTWPRLKIV